MGDASQRLELSADKLPDSILQEGLDLFDESHLEKLFDFLVGLFRDHQLFVLTSDFIVL